MLTRALKEQIRADGRRAWRRDPRLAVDAVAREAARLRVGMGMGMGMSRQPESLPVRQQALYFEILAELAKLRSEMLTAPQEGALEALRRFHTISKPDAPRHARLHVTRREGGVPTYVEPPRRWRSQAIA